MFTDAEVSKLPCFFLFWHMLHLEDCGTSAGEER
jgi:hypothetical protein